MRLSDGGSASVAAGGAWPRILLPPAPRLCLAWRCDSCSGTRLGKSRFADWSCNKRCWKPEERGWGPRKGSCATGSLLPSSLAQGAGSGHVPGGGTREELPRGGSVPAPRGGLCACSGPAAGRPGAGGTVMFFQCLLAELGPGSSCCPEFRSSFPGLCVGRESRLVTLPGGCRGPELGSQQSAAPGRCAASSRPGPTAPMPAAAAC